jgi:hypothetical protein
MHEPPEAVKTINLNISEVGNEMYALVLKTYGFGMAVVFCSVTAFQLSKSIDPVQGIDASIITSSISPRVESLLVKGMPYSERCE